jgi:hypothetical protein
MHQRVPRTLSTVRLPPYSHRLLAGPLALRRWLEHVTQLLIVQRHEALRPMFPGDGHGEIIPSSLGLPEELCIYTHYIHKSKEIACHSYLSLIHITIT